MRRPLQRARLANGCHVICDRISESDRRPLYWRIITEYIHVDRQTGTIVEDEFSDDRSIIYNGARPGSSARSPSSRVSALP